MEISSTILEFDFDFIATSFIRGAMERLSDIPEEVDDVFQCIGTRLTDVVIGKTGSENFRIICNSGDDAASGTTVSLENHRT
jgi:hypothetical protein